MRATVQISLDVLTVDEALSTAELALRCGVDWLEAGTPLILAEGLRSVQALHERFPDHPIVADLKTMDGGYLEAEMMAKAGATHVVVMERAHEETIKCVVKAGRDVQHFLGHLSQVSRDSIPVHRHDGECLEDEQIECSAQQFHARVGRCRRHIESLGDRNTMSSAGWLRKMPHDLSSMLLAIPFRCAVH